MGFIQFLQNDYRPMNHIFLLIMIQFSLDSDVAKNLYLPDDFDFVYSFGVDEKNHFDSKQERYVADMICEPSIEIDLPLSKIEEQKIWQSVIENQFFELDDFIEICDAFGNCIMVEPEQKITLTITTNGEQHSVHYREGYYGNDKNLFKFKNITKTIQEILDKKEEVKNLPTPTCAYL